MGKLYTMQDNKLIDKQIYRDPCYIGYFNTSLNLSKLNAIV